ncbi:hypothetical protein F2P45_29915 [Massilia sp. CCM 8733]|uniref:Uncharacterized protein n=1 Tax=Massilia mucilaginosa TaxID=2609282 RepID=A0ABX0P260_9BURK|nr:hypothetical protein [Massilia mucilaginosa]NHZ93197.1 hypothetical protein [Massilia mucilaginosa]
MPHTSEFAEQYTRAERLRLGLLILPAGLALLVATKLWFFPALAAFAASAECREIGGVNGITLLMYGLFVGLPLLLALVLGATVGVAGYKSLRSGQFPPAGTKVLRPTRIRRGRRATLTGAACLLLALAPLALAAWGWFQAGAQTDAAACVAIRAASPAP